MYQSESTFADFEKSSIHVEYAGFWLRVVAYLIDAIILYIPGRLINYFLGVQTSFTWYGGRISGAEINWTSYILAMLFTMILQWLYFSLMESSAKQATLGKMLLKLKVTNMDGNRISMANATGRFFAKYLSAMILLIGYMMAGWTEKKQGLHDIIANTLVVKGNTNDVISEHTTTEGY